MKKLFYLFIFVLSLAIESGYAEDVSKSVLIPDARYESLTWWTNSVYCADRSVVAGILARVVRTENMQDKK